MNDVEKAILLLIRDKPLSVNEIYLALNKTHNFSERIVKENLLNLRERYIIKPNRLWKMCLTE